MIMVVVESGRKLLKINILRKIFSRGIGLVLLIKYTIRRILQKVCLG